MKAFTIKELRRKYYLNRREKSLKESSNYYSKNKDKISSYKKKLYREHKKNTTN